MFPFSRCVLHRRACRLLWELSQHPDVEDRIVKEVRDRGTTDPPERTDRAQSPNLSWERRGKNDCTSSVLTHCRICVGWQMEEVFGSREPTYEDMHKLTYTQAVISETLRLHPSVPVDVKVR